MREKEPIVGSTDYGKDDDSAKSLLKKHRALMSDLVGRVIFMIHEFSLKNK